MHKHRRCADRTCSSNADRAPTRIALEAERPNLHAAVDYAAASGRSPHAVQIPAAMSGFLADRGLLDQSRALHQIALAAARGSGDRPGQATALGELGVLAWLTGDYPGP